MNNAWVLAIEGAIIIILFASIAQFRTPLSAKRGNWTAAAALLLAAAVVFFSEELHSLSLVVIALAIGAVVGWYVSFRLNMLQIPAMVGFQNGAGGFAAFLISFIQLTHQHATIAPVEQVSGILGIVTGAATFSGSMVASGKLAGMIRQTPIYLPKHNTILAGILAAIAILTVFSQLTVGHSLVLTLWALVLLAMLLGGFFCIRVGGADMPVLISFLNAASGMAGAFCGIVIESRLLIACGATVAASGSILTHAMCRAMNRDLINVLVARDMKGSLPASEMGSRAVPPAEAIAQEKTKQHSDRTNLERAIDALQVSQSVIVIPGYGMALAHAQSETVQMANSLIKKGKQVRFAIHPVAGRMPGHMHVLLAEADADPEMLFDLPEINSQFQETDLALIVGACDVVNPAAITAKGTPISGMPILAAHEARYVLVCNLDERPGYSGVENPLYNNPKTILMVGNAKDTLNQLLQAFDASSRS